MKTPAIFHSHVIPQQSCTDFCMKDEQFEDLHKQRCPTHWKFMTHVTLAMRQFNVVRKEKSFWKKYRERKNVPENFWKFTE